jgi:hypothetical protein
MPAGPSSAASWRHSPAGALHATCASRRAGIASRPPAHSEDDTRAARRHLPSHRSGDVQVGRHDFTTGRRTRTGDNSVRSLACTSSLATALNTMSIRADAPTASACARTAQGFRTSTAAGLQDGPDRRLERRHVPADEMHDGTLTGICPGHRGSHRTSRRIDDGNQTRQQHQTAPPPAAADALPGRC